MMHGQIILRLYTTLINLSPTAYKERTKNKREKRGKGKKEVLKLSSLLLSSAVKTAMSSQQRNSQQLGFRSSAGLSPEGFHLAIRQVDVVPGPQQLQLGLQLGEVRQDSGQCQPGPPLDLVDGHCINAALDQLCR
jgi:hypothetical protein